MRHTRTYIDVNILIPDVFEAQGDKLICCRKGLVFIDI